MARRNTTSSATKQTKAQHEAAARTHLEALREIYQDELEGLEQKREDLETAIDELDEALEALDRGVANVE